MCCFPFLIIIYTVNNSTSGLLSFSTMKTITLWCFFPIIQMMIGTTGGKDGKADCTRGNHTGQKTGSK